MTFPSDDRSVPENRRAPEKISDFFGEEDGREDGPLSWDEVGFLLNSIAGASRQWRVATQRIRDEFALKPRGPWILGLIYSGKVIFPADLAKWFKCSPSLITAELERVIDAGLVNTRKHHADGRQLELSLTPLGVEVSQRISNAVLDMVQIPLSGYSKAEIMLCARLLRDFADQLK